MGVLRRIAEAYRAPLLEATRLTHTPIHGDAVICPFTGLTTSTSTCERCPRYVRTEMLEIADGFWMQPMIACDPARPAPEAPAAS